MSTLDTEQWERAGHPNAQLWRISVPGGWLYRFSKPDGSATIAFVPKPDMTIRDAVDEISGNILDAVGRLGDES